MTIPAGDIWCSSCQEACHDHPRICTVCGTTLTRPPDAETSSSSRSTRASNPHTIIPDHLVDEIRAGTQRLRELTRRIQQEVESTRDAQQDLMQRLVLLREEFQAIPPALLDPAAGNSHAGRPTARSTLDSLPRICLEHTSTLFRNASIAVSRNSNDGGDEASWVMEAVPGEFGSGEGLRLEHATIIVAQPRTGKGGSLSEATLQEIARCTTRQEQQKADDDDEKVKPNSAFILYLERGDDVSFVQKALLAQRAGAQAVIIGNNFAKPWPYIMRDSKNEAVIHNLTIPVVMVKQSDGHALVSQCQAAAATSKKAGNIASTTATISIESSQSKKDCVICTEPFQVGQTVLQLPSCGHIFHDACALQWLEKHNTCPYCRWELATDDAEYEQERRRVERTHAGSERSSSSSTWNAFYG